MQLWHNNSKSTRIYIGTNTQTHIRTRVTVIQMHAQMTKQNSTIGSTTCAACLLVHVFMRPVKLRSAKSLPSKQTWINNCLYLLTTWNWSRDKQLSMHMNYFILTTIYDARHFKHENAIPSSIFRWKCNFSFSLIYALHVARWMYFPWNLCTRFTRELKNCFWILGFKFCFCLHKWDINGMHFHLS